MGWKAESNKSKEQSAKSKGNGRAFLRSVLYSWHLALCSLPFSTFMPNSAACFAESFAPSISTTFWRQRKRKVIQNNPTTRTFEESSGRDIYTMENAGRLETIKDERPAGLRRS